MQHTTSTARHQDPPGRLRSMCLHMYGCNKATKQSSKADNGDDGGLYPGRFPLLNWG